MKKNIEIFFIIFLLFISAIPAQLFSAEKAKRPKVGVVLSGGGAKGFAHISVLRTLEKLNIPVDYIGGTSMGSIIAGLYSLGYSVDEIESIARDTDWTQYFENKSDRSSTSLIQKIYFHEYPINLDVTKDGIKAPRGLVNGQRTGLFLSRLSWGAQHINNYRELPIPFICFGTDFENGKSVEFNKGVLAESLRASMAIPSVFDPVQIDGRIYLDGGVVNNFPAKEVRDMGADIIIGVDVSSRLYKNEDLTSVPKIMEQAISFLGEIRTMEQRKFCDILIIPEIGGYSALEFQKTDEIIKKGEEATRLQMEKLKQLSEQMSSYEIGKRGRAVSSGEYSGIVINRVRYHNLKSISKSVISQYLDIKPGEKVTVDQIEESINTIYGLNFFDRVNYNIGKDESGNVLNVYFEESSESHLNFGLSFNTDLEAAILAGIEIRNLGFKNTETILKARLGKYSNYDFTYLIYTPINPGVWFDVNANLYNMDFFVYEGTNKTAVYNFWYQSSSVDLNSFYSNWLLLSFGMRKEFFFIDADIATEPEQDSYRFDVLAYNAGLKIDTLDRKSYSTSGIFLNTEYDYVRSDHTFYEDVLVDKEFYRALLDINIAIPFRDRFAFHGGGSSSSVSSKSSPPSYWFAMGGSQRYASWIFPLNGYQMMEKTGIHGWVYYVDLQYEVFTNFFVITRWNEGKAVEDYNDLFEYSDTFAAYGLIGGYLSRLGPVEVGVFRKYDKRDYAFNFSLGFIF